MAISARRSADYASGLPGTTDSRPKLTLGAVLRGWRMRHGLTLKEMSARTGVPFSTLAKVEHDRLTLTYEKLQLISERLGTPLSALFSESAGPHSTGPNSRRSMATRAGALHVATPNYDYFYMSPELRNKAMIPVYAVIKAATLEEFGDLVRHRGEEFFYVLKGRVAVHTEFYDPVVLDAGEGIYFDGGMGHAYVLAEGCTDASALFVGSTSQEELIGNAKAAALNGHVVREEPPPAAAKRVRAARRKS